MDVDDHIGHLEVAGRRVVRAASWGGLTAPVPTCPGWVVSDVLRHLTEVHSWANWIVGGGDRKQFVFAPTPEAGVVEAYEHSLDTLLDTLKRVPDDLDVWSFLPAPSPKAFWARRQAHETTIHAVDVELAVDTGLSDIDHELAVDGLAELLMGFVPRNIKAGAATELKAIMFAPIDANISWTVDIGPDAAATTLENAPNVADLSVMASAADLYRWAWNRASDFEVSLHGDVALTDLWRSILQIKWR